MRRRHYVVAGAVTVASLAGCLDLSGTDSPEEVVESYFAAMDDGDTDAMEELRHEDGQVSDVIPAEFEGADDLDVDLEETELEEEAENVAVVRYAVTFAHPQVGVQPEEGAFELRSNDDEWRIYADRDATDPAEPEASYDVEQTVDDSELVDVTVSVTAADQLDGTDVVGMGDCDTYRESDVDLTEEGDSISLDMERLATHCQDASGVQLVAAYDGAESVAHTFELEAEPVSPDSES